VQKRSFELGLEIPKFLEFVVAERLVETPRAAELRDFIGFSSFETSL